MSGFPRRPSSTGVSTPNSAGSTFLFYLTTNTYCTRRAYDSDSFILSLPFSSFSASCQNPLHNQERQPPSDCLGRLASGRGILRSPLASPLSCLSIRPIRLPDSHSQSSGRVSRLASRVDTMSLMEARSFYQLPPPIAVSPPGLLMNMEDCALAKSFSPSPTLSVMDADTPWYRYCRPTAPIPPVSDSIETGSLNVAITNPTTGPPCADVPMSGEDKVDQENLSPPQPPSATPPFVQPLTAVSNILQSPVMFGERLPKWSVLRRSESNPMPPPHPSLRPSASAELLNQISLRSPLRGEEYFHSHSRPLVTTAIVIAATNATTSPRDSPQTPPVSVFDRRRSWFTSRAAPGVTRPRVLKHGGPVLPLNLLASRTNDLHSLKRTATNGYNTCEESVKKSRVHSLVPSERSAFLPVAHSRQTGLIDSSDSSSIAMDDGDDDDDIDEERKPINLLPPAPLPSNSI
ncbi:hypothetical protein Aperf_G00000033401 [Anoplocephala perfoliata]